MPSRSDRHLARRLRQMHDALIDIGYRLPALAREARELADILQSTETPERQLSLTDEHGPPAGHGRQPETGETAELAG